MTALIITISLIGLVSVLLVLVVLIQNPKGGGLSGEFGGSSASQIMGVKGTNDLLENVTWSLAGALMILCVSTGFMIGEPEARDTFNSSDIDPAIQSAPLQQQGSLGGENNSTFEQESSESSDEGKSLEEALGEE